MTDKYHYKKRYLMLEIKQMNIKGVSDIYNYIKSLNVNPNKADESDIMSMIANINMSLMFYASESSFIKINKFVSSYLTRKATK